MTFAAGMAKAGLKPVFAVYSSFLQRAYDQVLHDVCAQNLPVVFAVDRAGLVGKDGATHQGIFDLSYLSSIPNLTVMAPKNKWELSDMLKYAIAAEEPVAIRYPRGEACDLWKDQRVPIQKGCAEVLAEGCTFCDRFDGGNRLAGKKKTGRKRNPDNGGKCKICHATG